MRLKSDQLSFSASDLARHLGCRHLTSLDLLAVRGEISRPHWHDPAVAILEERGFRHETAYLAHLKNLGIDVTEADQDAEESPSPQQTREAMRSGAQVIVQAELEDGRWHGRADILRRIDRPSRLGGWSYEVVDTKLARETKAGTILQLCLYSELVGQIQGMMPERTHVVAPGRDYEPETFRTKDYLAYYRFVKARLQHAVDGFNGVVTYPEPVEQCEICRWWPHCNDKRRADDHLSFVAGISKKQIAELRKSDIDTLACLANASFPLPRRPARGNLDCYTKIHNQARLQLERRITGKPVHELLALEAERGLARLPEPSPGDIFLDFEADPFVEEGGIEYLLGYASLNEEGEAAYHRTWALDRTAERRAFESFIDTVMERRSHFPALHIYHFSPYEPAALKRLMGRYATREDEMDRLLRAGVLVDLHRVVKQALRASVETYSLKELEVFYDFRRATPLVDARQSLRGLECILELGQVRDVPPNLLDTVEAYNREDCISTWKLRDWLESVRRRVIEAGNSVARPVATDGEPSETVDERRQRVLGLFQRLVHNISDNERNRSPEERARWLLAHMLEFHRREEKAPWWEYFRLRELTDEELMEEPVAISGLEFVKRVGGTERCPIDRYRFPAQETQVRDGDRLNTSTDDFGTVDTIDLAGCTIDVKKTSAMAEIHPKSVFAHTVISGKEMAESLYRIGIWIADHGIHAPGPYRAARDLLLRKPPRLKGGAPDMLCRPGEDVVTEAQRLAMLLDHSVLPIQGPPGAGKTYTAARMITHLVQAGRTVGITAVSHKVIRKLLDETAAAAAKENVSVQCVQKVMDKSDDCPEGIREVKSNKQVLGALSDGEAQIGAGTAWLWSRPEFAQSVDVLFVDEAGQMSLADVLAVSQAAKSLVLLGDPQQLEQPIQGTHPPGTATAALQHLLGKNQTMPDDSGIFLAETWRLAPAICQFTSELFYESRLAPHAGLERQRLTGPTRFAGAGLWFVPVAHEGNHNCCDGEAEMVEEIVKDLLQSRVCWTDMKGLTQTLRLEDVLIVSPYNAQVFNLAGRIPGARVGTVDKFQGQEAPVVIYSMATSTPEDAPRGMEFLYSTNRFNVATSRARCVSIVVASPRLLEPDCRTPRQIKLANALNRYVELTRR